VEDVTSPAYLMESTSFTVTQNTHPVIYYSWGSLDTLYSFDTVTLQHANITISDLNWNTTYGLSSLIVYNNDLWFLLEQGTRSALISFNLENETSTVWLEVNDTNDISIACFTVSDSIYYIENIDQNWLNQTIGI
jgi:hypothetical protein